MAFSATPIDRVPNRIGDKKIIVGKFSNDSASTGGNIDTGLRVCDNLLLQVLGTAAGTAFPVVRSGTAFPVAGGNVPIVTQANAIGLYTAYGS